MSIRRTRNDRGANFAFLSYYPNQGRFEMAATNQSVVDESVEALPEPAENESPENESGEPGTTNTTDADQLDGLADAAIQCRLAADALDVAKAITKDRKAEYEGCVLKLRRLGEAIRNDEDRPLFDGLNDGQEEPQNDGPYEDCLGAAIAVLELRPAIEAKLNTAKVWTVGDLDCARRLGWGRRNG